MIYFAWIDSWSEPFDPVAHAREDEMVFGIRVSQAEGEFAKAEVEIENPGIALLNGARKRFCLISYSLDEESPPLPLFRGRVSGFPSDIMSQTVTLEFIAEPEGYKDDLAALAETLKTAPFWDDLFVDDGSLDDPVEVLEARSALFHWDRRTGALTVSDYLVGEEFLDLDQDWFEDSLRPSLTSPPLTAVNVVLKAEWEQRSTGRVDIAPILRAKLSDQFWDAATYTPQDFENCLPKPGDSIGSGSGWTIERVKVVRKGRRFKAVDYYVSGQTPQGVPIPRFLRMARHQYDIDDVIAKWEYSQKRREKAKFTVEQGCQPLLSEAGRTETLELSLQDVSKDRTTPVWIPGTAYSVGNIVMYGSRPWRCVTAHAAETFQPVLYDLGAGTSVTRWTREPEDSSAIGRADRDAFLDTARGKQAVEHAILLAQAKLRASLRAVELTVEGRWNELAEIDLRHSVRIAGPGIPGGEATGKLIRYEMSTSGDAEPVVSITIGCAVGTGGTAAVPVSGFGWVEDGFVDPAAVSTDGESEAVPGVVYSISGPQPVRRVRLSSLIQPSYAVTRCRAYGTASEQEGAARTAFRWGPSESDKAGGLTYDQAASSAVEAALSETPTRLSLEMRSLAGEDSLDRELAVTVKPILDTPKGIDLTGA